MKPTRAQARILLKRQTELEAQGWTFYILQQLTGNSHGNSKPTSTIFAQANNGHYTTAQYVGEDPYFLMLAQLIQNIDEITAHQSTSKKVKHELRSAAG